MKYIIIQAICLLSICSPLFAETYTQGTSLKTFHANDQHDQPFDLNPSDTRYLIVTHDMDTGKKTNAVLNTLGNTFLTEKKAIYLANIYGMPSIGRFFAIPKMRKYSHRIILADDANLIALFPEQKNQATILALSNGKISAVHYWNPEDPQSLNKIIP
jgi:hypothetical protein